MKVNSPEGGRRPSVTQSQKINLKKFVRWSEQCGICGVEWLIESDQLRD